MDADGLVRAIRAALDETERLARAVLRITTPVGFVVDDLVAYEPVEWVLQKFPFAVRQHIAHNDPAAVLRRVAADREILAEHSVIWRHTLSYDDDDDNCERGCSICEHEAELPVCVTCVPRHSSFKSRADVPLWPCKTVRSLARGLGINPEETP